MIEKKKLREAIRHKKKHIQDYNCIVDTLLADGKRGIICHNCVNCSVDDNCGCSNLRSEVVC